jgi:hypothetical protein
MNSTPAARSAELQTRHFTCRAAPPSSGRVAGVHARAEHGPKRGCGAPLSNVGPASMEGCAAVNRRNQSRRSPYHLPRAAEAIGDWPRRVPIFALTATFCFRFASVLHLLSRYASK